MAKGKLTTGFMIGGEEKLFTSDDISQGWDGKKNDTDCPGGVYVYRITFRVDGIEEEQVMAGTVAVVR
jgi:hypothetical protein